MKANQYYVTLDEYNDLMKKIYPWICGKTYSDIFPTVRQRSVAYKLYRQFFHMLPYGKEKSKNYLDLAYKFLNSSIDPDFILYLARKEQFDDPIDYIKCLVINP